jgi:hypothetical protein
MNNLPVVDRRLIESKFWGKSVSLPGFDKVITLLHSNVTVCMRAKNSGSNNVWYEQGVFLDGLWAIRLQDRQFRRFYSILTNSLIL